MIFSDYERPEVQEEYRRIVAARFVDSPRFLARAIFGKIVSIQMCETPEEVIAFFVANLQKVPTQFQIEDRLRIRDSGALLKNKAYDEQMFRDFMAEASIDDAAKQEFLKALRESDLKAEAETLAKTK